MMSNQDWRHLIEEWKEEGVIKHIPEEVKKEYEISTLMIELEKQQKYPIMIFDNVENNEIPVITNVLGTRDRFAKAMGVEGKNVAEEYAKRIKNRIDTQKVIENPPFMANSMIGDEVDLYKLPIITHFPIDAGPFLHCYSPCNYFFIIMTIFYFIVNGVCSFGIIIYITRYFYFTC